MLLLDTFFAWLVRTSAEAAVMVILILAVQYLLRNRIGARWRYALWMILLVRLVMPWTIESPLSIYNALPVSMDVQPLLSSSGWREAYTSSSGRSPALPATEEAAPSAREETENDSAWILSAETIPFGVLWFAGLLLFLAHIVVTNLRFWLLVRKASALDDPAIRDLLLRCRTIMGVRTNVRLVATVAVTSPALFGLWRPRLLLPARMLESVDPTALRYVFLHELSHLKRQDVLVAWLTTLLQAVHWFNPLLWYAFQRMRADRETACDALALSRVQPEESTQYGHTIIALLENAGHWRRVPGMAGIVEDGSQIKRRLSMIALFTKDSYRWSVLATIVIALMGAGLLTKAQAVPKAGAAPSAATATDGGDPPGAKALFDTAENLYGQKKYNEAIEKYREVYEKYPTWKYAGTSMMMIGICHEHMGDMEQAVKDLEAAAKEYPDVKGFSESIHFYLGDTYVAVGRKAEALVEFKTCVALCEISGKRGFQYDDSKKWIAELEKNRGAQVAVPRLQFRWVANEGETGPVDVITGYSQDGAAPKSYRVTKELVLSDKDIRQAHAEPDSHNPGYHNVLVLLKDEAAKRFREVTKANLA